MKLRDLMKVEQEKPAVEVPAPVKVVRRSETGMIITKRNTWRRVTGIEGASERKFEIDEYSQA
jgi:hypothetical protein